ncbi:MAG: hypothetical protein ACP5FR_02115 [Candidatus Micrarchaeia archaeon]
MFDFVGYAKKTKSMQKNNYCTHCGAMTASLGNMAICSRCEAIAQQAPIKSEATELLKSKLDDIRASINSHQYDKAIAGYEELFTSTKDPLYLYVEALAYIEHSNDEIAMVDYNKPGFMEENSLHKANSIALFSKAKELLAKSSSMLLADMKNGVSTQNLYHFFLVNMKFGDTAAVNSASEAIGKSADKYMHTYTLMRLSISKGNYEKALIQSESLLKANWQPVVVLYYVAYALFKRRDFDKAYEILKYIEPQIESGRASALLREIEKARQLL